MHPNIIKIIIHLQSQVKQGDPLNLSILLSGGKETNQDSPSNSERKGNSPGRKGTIH